MKDYDSQLEPSPDELILGVDYDELDFIPTLWMPDLGGCSPWLKGHYIEEATEEDYKEAAQRWAKYESETTPQERALCFKNSN